MWPARPIKEPRSKRADRTDSAVRAHQTPRRQSGRVGRAPPGRANQVCRLRVSVRLSVFACRRTRVVGSFIRDNEGGARQSGSARTAKCNERHFGTRPNGPSRRHPIFVSRCASARLAAAGLSWRRTAPEKTRGNSPTNESCCLFSVCGSCGGSLTTVSVLQVEEAAAQRLPRRRPGQRPGARRHGGRRRGRAPRHDGRVHGRPGAHEPLLQPALARRQLG